MRTRVKRAVCGCVLMGAAGAALGQPGYMHQRLIGRGANELFRDVRKMPIDGLTLDDFCSVSTGDIRAAGAFSDVIVVRKDPRGAVQWALTLPSPNGDEHGYKVAVEPFSGTIACVYTGTMFPGVQTGLVQLDPGGGMLSSLYLRGTGQAEIVNDRDVGVSVRIIDGDDRLITANVVTTVAFAQSGLLIRTIPPGFPLWTLRYTPAIEPSLLSFSDVTRLPGTPLVAPTYVVVGTIAETDASGLSGPAPEDRGGAARSIFVMRVDGGGAPLQTWIISPPPGNFLSVYGDGVDTISGKEVVISGHMVFNPQSPVGFLNVLIRFDPILGTITWNFVHRQLMPGRASVQWREGCTPGAAVAGEFRTQDATGFVLRQPMVLLTNDFGNVTSMLTHTDAKDARYDGVLHMEGVFGARVVADGWGDFASLGMGYGLEDALTVRGDQLDYTNFCPMGFPLVEDTFDFVVRETRVFIDQEDVVEEAPPPQDLGLDDTQFCVAGACDTIDFNNDGLIPDVQDLFDFLDVFAGGACSTGCCNDIDFNNDGVFPDIVDLNDFLNAFGGLPC